MNERKGVMTKNRPCWNWTVDCSAKYIFYLHLVFQINLIQRGMAQLTTNDFFLLKIKGVFLKKRRKKNQRKLGGKEKRGTAGSMSSPGPITSQPIHYKNQIIPLRFGPSPSRWCSVCLLVRNLMNLAGLQTEHGPTGDELIDLTRRRESHRCLRCQLMSAVYSSVP